MSGKAKLKAAAGWEDHEALLKFMEEVEKSMVWAAGSFPEEWKDFEEEPPLSINPLCLFVVPQGGMGWGVSYYLFINLSLSILLYFN